MFGQLKPVQFFHYSKKVISLFLKKLFHYFKKLFHYSILSNPYQEEREGEEKEQKNDVRSFVYSDYFCGNLKTKHRKCRYVKKQETNTF